VTHESSSAIVTYDGQCEFCIAWLRWQQLKLDVTAISFHDADLTQYGLSFDECSQSVFVVTPTGKYAGAAAIAFLLKARGNWLPALFLRGLGPIGRTGYRWTALHRNSFVIKYWTKLLERGLAHES
jgi:predicted DCC family thiol-disulfide oxidoreductase YuxK